jgi:hypothetical protein
MRKCGENQLISAGHADEVPNVATPALADRSASGATIYSTSSIVGAARFGPPAIRPGFSRNFYHSDMIV